MHATLVEAKPLTKEAARVTLHCGCCGCKGCLAARLCAAAGVDALRNINQSTLCELSWQPRFHMTLTSIITVLRQLEARSDARALPCTVVSETSTWSCHTRATPHWCAVVPHYCCSQARAPPVEARQLCTPCEFCPSSTHGSAHNVAAEGVRDAVHPAWRRRLVQRVLSW